jgi:hypothetical protein
VGRTQPRKAFPSNEKGQHVVKTITSSPTLDESGKTHSKQGLPGGSGIHPEKDEDKKLKKGEDGEEYSAAKALYVPIFKANVERQTITGVVLEPDTVDAHGDIIPEEVIVNAAEDFLANINVNTTMGLMHKDMSPPVELVQSFIVPDQDITINSTLVKKGSWVIVAKVHDANIWKQVKDGKLTGFSIGGTAKVKSIQPQITV